ncbi:hypothetical protein [Catellatospora sp. TT07R-123]|uniref:hypothetical protein n=1 Tax=Catellatospora sp. TT07R-123 TaxID=2733863 RepID=UPI001BB43B3D|nr:hypothetical protein [Catellatospora sp. TT07R-123]
MTSSGETVNQAGPEHKLSEPDFPVTVRPRNGSHEELVEMGLRYWDLLGVAEDGRPVWAVTTRQIGPDPGTQPHMTALAGVIAEVPNVVCRTCATTPWQPASRAAFESLIRGGAPGRTCAACDATVQRAVAYILDPSWAGQRKFEATQRAQREQERQQQRLDQAGNARVNQRWAELRREAIENFAPLKLSGAPEWSEVTANVETEAVALACIRHAPATDPIPPIGSWAISPLTPNNDWSNSAAASFWRAGLLAVDPKSDASSFGLKFSLKEASEAADRSTWEQMAATLPDPIITGIYPLETSWYSPHGPTMQTAASWLDNHLAERLNPASMDVGRQQALLDLAARLIAAETIRYLEFQLDTLNLPPVADNHRPRLEQLVERLSKQRSLGETYHIAWQCARAAAAAAQTNPRAPRENMTTHAVNQFEQRAQDAVANPGQELKPWREDNRLPLSALTKLVFYGLLNVQPMHARLPAIADTLPEPIADLPDPLDTGLDEDEQESPTGQEVKLRDAVTIPGLAVSPIASAVQEILDNMALIDPEATMVKFRSIGDTLDVHADGPVTPLRGAVDAMTAACQDVVAATGDALLGLVAACATANAFMTPYTDSSGTECTMGVYLTEQLVTFAFDSQRENVQPRL